MAWRARRGGGAAVVAVAAVLVVGACSASDPDGSAAPSSTSTTAASAGASARGSDGEQGVGAAPAASTSLSGPVTVGLDFKPEVDGFGFENYGAAPGRTDLTAEEMRRFFGDAVCASTAGGQCILAPNAQQWMEAQNEKMAGGHCEGMATLALLIKKGTLKASDFGADATSGLTVDGNDKLSREIAYWFATQFLEPAQSVTLQPQTPNEVVAKLRASFQAGATESFTLGIYKIVDGLPKDGHAITPYGLVDRPDGKVEIAVYDNNFPGEARAVVVDPATETWTYSGSTNPNEPSGLYTGDATTSSLQLTPTSSRLGQLACPICGSESAALDGGKGSASTGGGAAAEPTGYLFLNEAGFDGGVVLTITSVDGSPLPGLKRVSTRSGGELADEDSAPTIEVPANAPFKVTIDGSKVSSEALTDITYVGADRDLYVDEIKVDPGQIDEAIFDPAKGQITYTTKRTEAPTIGAGYSAEGADFGFAIGGVDLPEGGSVSATLDQAAGTFTIKNEGDAAGSYAVGMVRIDDAGEQTFTDPGFDLPAKASVALGYREWSSKNDKLKVMVDLGDGSPPVTDEVQSD